MSSDAGTRTKTIDQRGKVLPPTWCPVPTVWAPPPEPAAGVMRTETSRHAANLLISAIQNAREVVVVSTFLLADDQIEGALLAAAQRGVRVYLLLATNARLEKEPREDSAFEQHAVETHKKMLNRLAGWALIRSAAGFHAKCVVVDPALGGRGFLLTANLTTEALTRNEEIVVELDAAEAAAVFEYLRWAMWDAAEHEFLEPGQMSGVADPLLHVGPPEVSGALVATLGTAGSLRSTALELIQRAEHEIVVASFGWDRDHATVEALVARASEGVPVTVLARPRAAVMPALIALAEAGAEVLGFKWLHAKALSTDDSDALVMTANFERYGLEQGFELGVVLKEQRASAVRMLLQAWSESPGYRLSLSPTLGEVEGEARVWVQTRLVPYRVAPSGTIPVGDRARSAGRDDSEVPLVAGEHGLPPPFHHVTLS